MGQIGTLDVRYARCGVATLAYARYVRRHGCHTELPLDPSGYTILHPMLQDAAHNTIISSDSLLIHPTSRAPLAY